jgi:hypothetical protein
MKKTIMTIAIVLGLSMTTFADGGGLFQRGNTPGQKEVTSTGLVTPNLPNHGGDENADAPLGTGIAVLTALGAAYLVGKKRREE